MTFIEVINESKIYQSGQEKIYANDQVNFEIEKGELAVILGSSGAGKSTVLNILGEWTQMMKVRSLLIRKRSPIFQIKN